MTQLSWFRASAALLSAFLLSGCGGEGGGSRAKSDVTLDVDGAPPMTSTEQSNGVDAAGDSIIMASGGGWTIAVKFPGTSAGMFSSANASGGLVTYTDAGGKVFEASDVLVGSAYTVDVVTYDSGLIEGTFTATVVASDGATHAISGSFKVVISGPNAGNPYGGTYIGMFRVQGQVQTGTDPMTSEPIWGPLQTAAFQVTIKLDHLGTASGIAAYNVVRASVNDPYFACMGGCDPVPNESVAVLPEEPGTPTPSGPSLDGQGIVVKFSNGTFFVTENAAGSLYTSTDGRMLSNTLGLPDAWGAVDIDAADPIYEQTKFGVSYLSLKADTRNKSWALTKSAF